MTSTLMKCFWPLLFLSACAIAGERTFRLLRDQEGKTGIRFSIGYTLGTHDGIIEDANGTLVLDAADQVLRGGFAVPVQALKTGNREKDCHLHESIGLDYSKSSFPDKHVCKDDELPKEGKDSLAFPQIRFEILRAKKLESKGTGESSFELTGRWGLHGMVREIGPVPIKLTWESEKKNQLRLQSRFPLRLEEFGIVVKKFLFIAVADEALVVLDLLLG